MVFCGLGTGRQVALHRIHLVGNRSTPHENPDHLSPPGDCDRDSSLREEPMSDQPNGSNDMPDEIDFSQAVRGLHHVPSEAKVFLPASIERSVWEYFSVKAQKKGVDLS